MISKELNCFFLKSHLGRTLFLDRQFAPCAAGDLNGLYAYVSYAAPALVALSELKEYGSQHGGLDAMVHVLKLHSLRVKQHLFATQMPFFLPKSQPIAGGEACFVKGELMWWNVKSALFSRPKKFLHDDSALLKHSISGIGFPIEKFIYIKQAVEFEQSALRILFHPNGHFKAGGMQLVITHMQTVDAEQIADVLCLSP